MLFVFFFRLNIDNGLNVPFLLLCVERAFPSAAAEAATDPTHTHTHTHTHTRARAHTTHTHTHLPQPPIDRHAQLRRPGCQQRLLGMGRGCFDCCKGGWRSPLPAWSSPPLPAQSQTPARPTVGRCALPGELVFQRLQAERHLRVV